MSIIGREPSLKEMASASEQMTDQERQQSVQREARFSSPESKSFDLKSNTLLLNINKDVLNLDNLTETAKQNNLQEKNEFHITVLGFKNGNIIKKALKGLSPEEQQVKTNQIQELVNQTNWQFIPEDRELHISKEYKSINPQTKEEVVSETRESYIQMIHMPALGQFYAQLNSLLGTNLVPPPTHTTLFTGGSDKEKSKMGIGINSEAELAELNPQTLASESVDNQTEKITDNEWSIEVLDKVKDIEPSQFDPERTWLATHFKITQPGGAIKEVESTKIILKINSKSGEEIEIPAFAIDHIMSLHLNAEQAGSTMSSDSVESSFQLISEHLPTEIPFNGGTAAFEIDVDQKTGTEGVSSIHEMLDSDVISQAEVDSLQSVRDDVFKLNLSSNDTDKESFINNFNAQMTGNLQLGIRGGAITPFFATERQETTKMFLVIGKEEDKDGSKHNRVWTMSPGRFMDKLPNDGKFSGRYDIPGIPEGTTTAQLISKAESGQTLSPEEIILINDQAKAQECWWDGGFVVSKE